jgi:hypothetical protein
MRIVRARLPDMEEELAGHVVRYVQAVRQLRLSKQPGVAETLDCAQALMALGKRRLDAEGVEETLGCISKSVEDSERVRTASGDLLLASTRGRR